MGPVNIIGDEHGSDISFCTFWVLQFWAFLRILAVFVHFWGFSGNLGVLRAIVSYKVTRRIILVVGRVTEGFWGDLGGSQGSRGGLLYPYTALFAPLEVLYGTRFGSKHHIMVQLYKFF